MPKRKKLDEHESLRPGWSEPREVKDEPHVSNFNISRNVGGWRERAPANSGPKIAPGIAGKSS
jgi:hypothetical protein